MNPKTKILFSFALILAVFGFLLIWQTRNLGKLRMIFCDVGQGDGILMITPGGSQVLMDGGPGIKITDCLSRYMPFWDRQVEMIFNTHPQQDHLEGLVEVLNRYDVARIGTTGVSYKSKLFDEWQAAIKRENAKNFMVSAGQIYKIDKIKMEILWPTAEALNEWKAYAPGDVNESSIIARVVYGDFCAYLTGDIPKETLDKVIDRPCPVLKVAHHGSLTGTDEKTIDEINPKIAVIQVGKNNRYGHPKKETLDILEKHNVKILRNDLSGDIEVDTDGKGIEVSD